MKIGTIPKERIPWNENTRAAVGDDISMHMMYANKTLEAQERYLEDMEGRS